MKILISIYKLTTLPCCTVSTHPSPHPRKKKAIWAPFQFSITRTPVTSHILASPNGGGGSSQVVSRFFLFFSSSSFNFRGGCRGRVTAGTFAICSSRHQRFCSSHACNPQSAGHLQADGRQRLRGTGPCVRVRFPAHAPRVAAEAMRNALHLRRVLLVALKPLE